MNIAHFLAETPFFHGLEESLLLSLADIAVLKSHKSGEIIFAEKDPGTGFYLVAEGQVKIFKSAPDGKEQILHIFGPGEPFGEVAIFLGWGFPAWALALENSKTIFFPRAALRRLIGQNPDLAFGMMAVLSMRLIRFTHMVEALTLKEVPARLAAFLVNLSQENNDTLKVELKVSKSQLASLLGTVPETISRAMGRLKSAGLINEEKPHIIILDPMKLKAFAAGEENLL